ncbi:MAG: motility associated factor glycosyltransferase family protein [Spirochaetales bacterium]|nr:motility associated factor glycosyltransferase family protein [Spirochaetales bacterium]
MKDYTENNLEALYRHRPELKAAGLQATEGSAEIMIEQTPSGCPTAKLRGTYLHSRYDPMKEARRIISREAPSGTSGAVVLGFGLGYLPEAFCESHPDKPLLVIEEDSALFLQALAARDMRKLLGRRSVTWCIAHEPQALMPRLEQLPLRALRVLRLSAFRDNLYYRQADTLLSTVFDKQRVNINTLGRFAALWVRNLLSNLARFTASAGIRAGRDSFSGVPALVLAAGPSLDEILPDLDALRQRFLLVAVDTSYRFCRLTDVEPDFLVTVDPQYWNSRHLDRLPRRGALLVSESSANPRIFRTAAGPEEDIFFVSSFFPLGTYIEEIIGQRGLIGAGGSVATTAWDLCRYLGCSAIYMAGLDLGFPGKQTHARGAFFEETMHTSSGRLSTAEQMTFDYLHQARPVALTNNRGGLTLSDQRMLIYKSWFENQIEQCARRGEADSYSLSAEGIAVRGMKHVELREALRLPVMRGRIDTILRQVRARGTEMIAGQRVEPVIAGMRGLIDELKRLEDLARRGEELSSHPSSPDTLVPALAEVDRQIMSLASRQIAGFLFQPLIRDILGESADGRDFEGVLDTSQKLYRELKASAFYHGQLIRKCLERLQVPAARRARPGVWRKRGPEAAPNAG